MAKRPLDVGLYGQYKRFAILETEPYFSDTAKRREKQFQLFVTGRQESPRLDYPRIKLADVSRRKSGLSALQHKLAGGEDAVSSAYFDATTSAIERLNLLEAAHQGSMEQFRKQSLQPDPRLFWHFVSIVWTQIEKALRASNFPMVADQLAQVWPEVPAGFGVIPLPSPARVKDIGKQLMAEFGYLLPDNLLTPTDETILDAEAIAEVFKRAIDLYDRPDWQVKVDRNAPNMSVDQNRRMIIVPTNRILKGAKGGGKMLHELLHWLRRVSGDQASLRLLGLGLADYLLMEEGLTTATEQAVLGRIEEYSGASAYLAVGFAVGVDGVPRNFRQLYHLLMTYFRFEFYRLKLDKPGKDEQTYITRSAWYRCVRTFRGTDCRTPGVCYTKDLVYASNIKMWELLTQHPECIPYLAMGKYDPTNLQHCRVLAELDLVPAADRWW